MKLDLTEYVPFLLNRAGSSIASAFTSVLDAHELSLPMWRVLAALHHTDGQRVGELASSTNVELWTVSRVLKAMERKGLLERRREASDERAVSVFVTKRGREMVSKIVPTALEYERHMLDGFAIEEISVLRGMLERLFENIEQLAALDGTGSENRTT